MVKKLSLQPNPGSLWPCSRSSPFDHSFFCGFGAVKLVMEKQIGVTWLGWALPKVPVEKEALKFRKKIKMVTEVLVKAGERNR